jgi:basic amino acid/polyamine antiporter, APA family
VPRALGRVHARSHAPYRAIICYATLAVVFALTGTFAELAVLSALASAAFYIAGCAAAWKLARQGVAQAGTRLNFRWLGTASRSMVGLRFLSCRSDGRTIGMGKGSYR